MNLTGHLSSLRCLLVGLITGSVEHRALGEAYRMPTPQFPRLHAGRGEPRGCRMYAPRVALTISTFQLRSTTTGSGDPIGTGRRKRMWIARGQSFTMKAGTAIGLGHPGWAGIRRADGTAETSTISRRPIPSFSPALAQWSPDRR